MIVLGIDPGYDRLGVAIIKKENGKEFLLYSDCFFSSKQRDLGGRLWEIGQQLEKLIIDWQPEAVAIEKVFFSLNQKTALQVAEARGMISYLIAKNNLPLIEYAPAEIKMTVTGSGNANKKQVSDMIPHLIKIDKEIKLDDEYDAIAIALTYLAKLQTEKLTKISTSKIKN